MHAERLRNLYAAMLKCRELGDVLCARANDQGCCRGDEAIIAGAAIHLKPADFVAPSAAELFARCIQGAPLAALLARSKRRHEKRVAVDAVSPKSIPAGTAMEIGTGMALACKMQNIAGLVSLCIARAPIASGWDAVEFAATRKLAIVFAVIDGTTSSPALPAKLRRDAQGLLPVITVDGNDAVAVYRVAEECTRRARQGLGPSVIECLLEPVRDPTSFMEQYLRERQLWSEDWKQNLVREARREAELVAKNYRR
jgi:TPP-dependent pyruvate/acetoin dehydrogenase alpha subunit